MRQNSLVRQNRHKLLAFPKFNKAVFYLPQEAKALLELIAIRFNSMAVAIDTPVDPEI